MSQAAPSRSLCLALALVCGSVLGAEIALTRLYSFLLHYHYSFLVLSGAVCGLGAGAVLAQRLSGTRALSLLAFGQGLGLWLAVVFAAWAPHAALPLLLGAAALPFALAGAFLSLVFRAHAGHSQRLYFYDLGGAALATLGIIPCLQWLGGVDVLLVCGVLAALAGGVCAADRRWGIGGVALFLAALLAQRGLEVVRIDLEELAGGGEKPMFKALGGAGAGKLVQTRWSAYARTDLVDRSGETGLNLYTDGGAGSYMFRFGGDFRRLFFLRQEAALFPYYFGPRGRALILGPGGGADVLYALMTGWQQIEGVEINAEVVGLVRQYGEYNGHLYDFDNVYIHVEDGRHYAERSAQTYDLIALPLVYASAAELAGYALQENYLFTQEAYQRYLELLHPQGRLALVVHEHRLMLKAVSTLAALWQAQGRDPAEFLDHLVVINGTRADTQSQEAFRPLLLVQKEAYSREQLQQLVEVAGHLELRPYFVPGFDEGSAIAALRREGLEGFVAKSSFDLRPVADQRPYFYQLAPGMDHTLMGLLAGSLAAVLLALGIRGAHQRRAAPLVFGGFAALLGAAFMLVEIYLLQRFSLLLGHPVLGLAVTLFGLLLASGAGALLGSRLPALRRGGGVALAAALTGVGGLLLAGIQGLVLPAALHLESAGRALAALLLILPLGLLMGLCFPAGLRLAGSAAPAQIAWMWGFNGIGSVCGSALAVVAGMQWGTNWALYCGAGAYLLAGGVMWLGRRAAGASAEAEAGLPWRSAALVLVVAVLVWLGVFSTLAGGGEALGPDRRPPPPVAPQIWPPGLRTVY